MSGDVTDAGQTTNKRALKIELLSQWKLEAEFRNLVFVFNTILKGHSETKNITDSGISSTFTQFQISYRKDL